MKSGCAFRLRRGGRIEPIPLGDYPCALNNRPDLASAPYFFFLPPLWDHHGHLAALGAMLEEIDLREASSAEEALTRLGKGGCSPPPGEWLIGFGWDQNGWPGGYPNRRQLDRYFPDRPVFLRRIDCHAAWINTEALKRAGFDDSTPDPGDGRILRADGVLTGIVLDGAMDSVERCIPKPSDETLKRRLIKTLVALKKAGLSGVTDMGTEAESVRILAGLDERGELPIPVEAYIRYERDALLPETPPNGPGFRVVGAKLFADGALGSRGAALKEDYSDRPGERGFLLRSDDELAEALTSVSNAGLRVAVHAIGDRALEQLLGALKKAKCGRGVRIEHVQVADPAQVERMSRLRITASVQPCYYLSDRAWARERLGKRIVNAYRLGSLKSAGIDLLVGTDFPVERPSPARNFRVALERSNETERISLETLLDAYAPPPEFRRTDAGAGTLAVLQVSPLTAGALVRDDTVFLVNETPGTPQ